MISIGGTESVSCSVKVSLESAIASEGTRAANTLERMDVSVVIIESAHTVEIPSAGRAAEWVILIYVVVDFL